MSLRLWAALGAIGLVIALIVAFEWYVEGQREEAYDAGRIDERAKWLARESEELAAANREIDRLHAEARQREQDGTAAIAALAGLHQEEMDHVQAQRNDFMDSLRDGRVRFYDPGATARAHACRDPGAEAAATTGRGDGEGGAALSEAATRFLYREADHADQVVGRLTLAQGVIEEYRRICR